MKQVHVNSPRIQSIRGTLKESYRMILTVMLCPMLALLLALLLMTQQYNRTIADINTATELQSELTQTLSGRLWDVVSGQSEFDTAAYEVFFAGIDASMQSLQHTSPGDTQAGAYLRAAQRAIDTLSQYTGRLHAQLDAQVSTSENEVLYREIKSVISMVEHMLQQYIAEEINAIAYQNQSIRRITFALAIVVALVFALMFALSVYTYRGVMDGVLRPIREMEVLANRVRQGDLRARVKQTEVEELRSLSDGLNLMVQRIDTLIAEQVQAQRDLQRAEIRILQEQITPHFVYNTMETIVWLAEEGRTQDVVNITMAFTDFFRISLSRGREFIKIREELQHIQSYIKIQQVRYHGLVTCEMLIDPDILDCSIAKLVLQPLVENAIYHGIKPRRDTGRITVTGVKTMSQRIMLVVRDDGIGMDAQSLQRVRDALQAETQPQDIGVGLFNVNQRLKLFYGASGLHIDSEAGVGTSISFEIPIEGEGGKP